jgi:hypothetical protein
VAALGLSHYPWGMGGWRPISSARIFRPRRLWAALMGAAGLLWIAVLIYLTQVDDVPLQTYLSAVFFVIFFLVALAYYGRTAIFVDHRGLTFRGMVRTQRLSFSDIRKVDVLPGPVTVYAIRAGGRFVHFTSFFRNHRDLVHLLVERAGLAPVRI